MAANYIWSSRLYDTMHRANHNDVTKKPRPNILIQFNSIHMIVRIFFIHRFSCVASLSLCTFATELLLLYLHYHYYYYDFVDHNHRIQLYYIQCAEADIFTQITKAWLTWHRECDKQPKR